MFSMGSSAGNRVPEIADSGHAGLRLHYYYILRTTCAEPWAVAVVFPGSENVLKSILDGAKAV